MHGVGLDIGGSAVKAGRLSADGARSPGRFVEFDFEAGSEAVLDGLAALARELGTEGALGIGVPGLLDRAAGCVRFSPNLPWLEGLALRDGLAARLDLSPEAVRLENDATVAALGEAWLGAARGLENALVLTLGTGIGGGLILGGELYRGAGQAGEIGHVTVDPGGPRCGCGSRGCLETLASATAAGRRAREVQLPADDPGNLVLLAENARRDSRSAEARLLTEIGRDLGHGLAQALLLLDLRTFVLAGGFAAALDVLEAGIRVGLSEWAYGERVGEVQLLPAELGREAGWIGAARLALHPPLP